MGALSLLEQASFRGRNDDGSQTTATWKDSVNTNWRQAVTTNFRVRFLVKHTGGATTPTFQLEYNKNSGGWNSVTTASSVCKAVNSTSITDGEATTQQVGAGTFVTGEMSEDGITAAISIGAATNETEVEYVLQLVSTDVTFGDTIELRVTNAGVALDIYTNTPAITLPGTRRIIVT